MNCPRCDKPMTHSEKMFICEPCREFVILLDPKSKPSLLAGQEQR